MNTLFLSALHQSYALLKFDFPMRKLVSARRESSRPLMK